MASSLTRRESRALAEQALSYRLSGDCDALHVAPHATFMAGVDGPILLRRRRTRALASLRGDETSRPPRLRRSPLGPIYPNKTPRMETWRRRTGKAAFHLTMLERQALVFNNSYAEFSKL